MKRIKAESIKVGQAMLVFGNPSMQALGNEILIADGEALAKIKDTRIIEWHRYIEMYDLFVFRGHRATCLLDDSIEEDNDTL